MKRIVIFGPPGCGKSTLIRELAKNYSAIDVEDSGNSYEERKTNFLNTVSKETEFTFYGGADLKLDDLPEQTSTLLICPSNYSLYKERVQERNKKLSYKSGQNEEEVYRWFYDNRDRFDFYIDNSNTIDITLSEILSILKGRQVL